MLLAARWCRRTRYRALGPCARTTPASQSTKRAARAHLATVLLGVTKAPRQRPAQPFSTSLVACTGTRPDESTIKARYNSALAIAVAVAVVITVPMSGLVIPHAEQATVAPLKRGDPRLRWRAAGRLGGAEARSEEVGARSALRSSNSPDLFDRSGCQAAQGVIRRHLLASTARQSRLQSGATNMKPGRRPTQPRPALHRQSDAAQRRKTPCAKRTEPYFNSAELLPSKRRAMINN